MVRVFLLNLLFAFYLSELPFAQPLDEVRLNDILQGFERQQADRRHPLSNEYVYVCNQDSCERGATVRLLIGGPLEHSPKAFAAEMSEYKRILEQRAELSGVWLFDDPAALPNERTPVYAINRELKKLDGSVLHLYDITHYSDAWTLRVHSIASTRAVAQRANRVFSLWVAAYLDLFHKTPSNKAKAKKLDFVVPGLAVKYLLHRDRPEVHCWEPECIKHTRGTYLATSERQQFSVSDWTNRISGTLRRFKADLIGEPAERLLRGFRVVELYYGKTQGGSVVWYHGALQHLSGTIFLDLTGHNRADVEYVANRILNSAIDWLTSTSRPP